MSGRLGHVVSSVSAEFLATSGAAGRRILREAMRAEATDFAGAPARLDRFQIDPFERHGDLDALPRSSESTHVVQARFRVEVQP